MDAPPLATQGLTKIYGRRRTVHNVNLHVPQGALYALLGPNGAGKTTTLRCLLGLTRPTSGTCLVLGQDVRRPEARRQVAGMIDAPAFYPNLTPAENLRVVAELRGFPSGRPWTPWGRWISGAPPTARPARSRWA
ncbi:ATP-binding cassette domain-containing protein [Deinococcus radiopugnans]|uniref:ATP-binding cassette domain-containing protein n=1 Tax=Deinococcus radiopugnans TaxID=57497 RepID=UPI00360A2540